MDMDIKPIIPARNGLSSSKDALVNGTIKMEPGLEPTLEELERELPDVPDDQIQLGDLLSRVVQSIYAELSELSETMPNMSDTARKRVLADWVVKMKKQVVKLYAVAKWSRDADTIQKCMNITAFLLTQSQQFEDVVGALRVAKDSLDPARLRNHDLLTSLDVLTTGSYLRLPSCIKKLTIPETPLTDTEVDKTFLDIEETIRFRLRMSEIIPIEMSEFRIGNGRAHFTVLDLFKTSLCLLGGAKDDGWFMVDVEFLINVGGDLTGLQEFPRKPPNIMKQHITDEANARLAFYLTLPDAPPLPPEAPPRPQLSEGVIDTPLIRIFNFLQMMSLSYQLEILCYQAQRMRSLGWANFLSVEMSPDRKTLKATYWLRPPVPQLPGRPKFKIPLNGGTLTISIVEKRSPIRDSKEPDRTPRQRVLSRIQQRAKLGDSKPSDEVEGLQFAVRWEAASGAFGVFVNPEEVTLPQGALQVNANNLDFESMLRMVIQRHAQAILRSFKNQLQHTSNKTFSPAGAVSLIIDEKTHALRVHLCGDEVVIITLDTRTGKLNMRDTGDLAAAGRAPRLAVYSDKINENPTWLMEALIRLRLTTITDFAEQKASYLGLRSYRRRNIPPNEAMKLGPDARSTLFIQLANFPDHYLVIVITDENFKYALITTKAIEDNTYAMMVLEDIAWLDFDRIREADPDETSKDTPRSMRKTLDGRTESGNTGFDLDNRGLREIYNYCCARVAFINVERQFKLRKINFTHVNPSNPIPSVELAHIQSSLARSVPALCVKSEDILSGAPAAEAAMPNIRVIPLNWWSHEKARVVTCVKLKYVQQPMGKRGMGGAVIRPSKRIVYDTREAIVSFLSEDVNSCVDEFLEEWARVSKMVVIAREVAQMSKLHQWHDVRLLSFDLQTVEFAYAQDYTVSISCEDQLSSTGGNFDLYFSRMESGDAMETDISFNSLNPHEEAEPFLRHILRHGHGKLSQSLHRLVKLLRETLPIVVELEEIRRDGNENGRNLDIFAKSAGWYRLLYGDLKHALDFRLMNDQRISVLDASHSLFGSRNLDPNAMRIDADIDNLVLQPIPQVKEIVAAAVKDALSAGILSSGKTAAMEVGIISDAVGIRALTKVIHAQVLERLKPQT
ncbi:mediator complex subunit MED14-domain-containing protein [Crepidotus variabilis]|uniref:Mediator of RNA polymerase II transcription subunit 14 n=1 Tax=Crepidotus variabilis TaxID=179855 RepID=A0A9P6JQ39_9AGAR|nr:mediator complex subunit MED14-domain-containing protein [Crepidotus variabilis]